MDGWMDGLIHRLIDGLMDSLIIHVCYALSDSPI